MPNPPPQSSHFFRCSGEAWRRRGNQASGAEIVRPSANRAAMDSPSMITSTIRSPGLGSEVAMPSLQKISCVRSNQTLDPREFGRAKPKVAGERHRLEPELRRGSIAVDVNMRRFVGFMTVKVYPVRSGSRPGVIAASSATRSKPSGATGSAWAREDRGLRPDCR